METYRHGTPRAYPLLLARPDFQGWAAPPLLDCPGAIFDPGSPRRAGEFDPVLRRSGRSSCSHSLDAAFCTSMGGGGTSPSSAGIGTLSRKTNLLRCWSAMCSTVKSVGVHDPVHFSRMMEWGGGRGCNCLLGANGDGAVCKVAVLVHFVKNKTCGCCVVFDLSPVLKSLAPIIP